jgi:cytochrome P450 family 6
MYELSVNEDIQDKARESVKDALEKHGNKLTYESVNEMDYLEQCVNGKKNQLSQYR